MMDALSISMSVQAADQFVKPGLLAFMAYSKVLRPYSPMASIINNAGLFCGNATKCINYHTSLLIFCP